MVAANRETLRAEGVRTLDLWYEDLYGPDDAPSDRVETLGSILRFLGCDIEDAGVARERIEQLLDPDRSKVNSTATYLRVPGMREIEERYGSDETGWLFR